jgi:hypothetical protein
VKRGFANGKVVIVILLLCAWFGDTFQKLFENKGSKKIWMMNDTIMRGQLPKPSVNPKPKELFLEMTFHSVVGFVQFMPLIYFIKQYSLCGFSW